jgi:hypothetical protein
MSDVFDDTLKRAAESFFQLPGVEQLTYRPRTGSARRIRAIVTRLGGEGLPGISGGSTATFNILVQNDATKGIDSATMDTGGDQIDVAPNLGEPPKSFRIAEILNHDAGLILLAVQ